MTWIDRRASERARRCVADRLAIAGQKSEVRTVGAAPLQHRSPQHGIVTPRRACGLSGGPLVARAAKGMKKISYSGRRFLPEIIQQTIWLYLRFTPSFRGVGDLLAERDIAVSYETIRRWVSHFGPMIAADLRKRRPKPPFRGRRERGRTCSGEAADPADTTRQRRHGEGVSRHEAPRLRVLRSADLRHRGAGSRRLPGARAVDANHV